jgi:hypothetical protein
MTNVACLSAVAQTNKEPQNSTLHSRLLWYMRSTLSIQLDSVKTTHIYSQAYTTQVIGRSISGRQQIEGEEVCVLSSAGTDTTRLRKGKLIDKGPLHFSCGPELGGKRRIRSPKEIREDAVRL